MARVIAIANQKGGVGKTTTAINLAAGLAAAERRTLLIDMDPQGNAGSGLGMDRATLDQTIYNVLIGECALPQIIKKSELAFLDIAPSGPDLAGAEIELVSALARETKLKGALEAVRATYDFILIDCPPSLGLLTLNALTAADRVLIPLQAEYYAMEGLSSLLQTIDLVSSHLNPTLMREGIVLTMMDQRNNLCRQVEADVRAHLGKEVFETVIPRNVRLSEAPSHGKPVILYDVVSKGANSYLALTHEFLVRTGNLEATKPHADIARSDRASVPQDRNPVVDVGFEAPSDAVVVNTVGNNKPIIDGTWE